MTSEFFFFFWGGVGVKGFDSGFDRGFNGFKPNSYPFLGIHYQVTTHWALTAVHRGTRVPQCCTRMQACLVGVMFWLL